MGLVDDEDYHDFIKKKDRIQSELDRLNKIILYPTPGNNDRLKALKTSPLKNPVPLSELLRRPQVSYTGLVFFDPNCTSIEPEITEQVEIQIKYAGYIQRQEEQVGRLKKLEGMRLPGEVNYENIAGLSTEVKEKLSRIRPLSIGQASRISGVTPAALSILMIYLKKLDHTKKNSRKEN